MKKILSLVLVLSLVLGTFSFAFAATPPDVVGEDSEKAVETLMALGVVDGYDDGTYKPEKAVTRAEMTKLLVEALGYGELAEGANASFTDAQGHWAESYIGFAASMDLVLGYPDGTFKPNQVMSMDEAMTMVIRALGYTDEVLKGTWPTNYKVKALDLELTDGLSSLSGQGLRGNVAILLYNALDAKLVEVIKDADGLYRYDFIEVDSDTDKMLIDQVGDKVEDEFIDVADVWGDDAFSVAEGVDLETYLFNTISFYGNDDYDVAYISDVATEEVEGTITTSGTSMVVEDADEDEWDFTVDADTLLYYNDDEADSKTAPELEADITDVTVVYDEDDVVQGIVAWEYEVDLIGSEYSFRTPLKINGAGGWSLPETDDEDLDEDAVTVEGDATSLEEIEKDDVVYYYASEGLTKVKLLVVRDTFTGKLTELDAKKDTGVFSGTTLDLSSDTSLTWASSDLGTVYDLILDKDGDVYSMSEADEQVTETYAIYISSADGVVDDSDFAEEDYSVDTPARVKLFTSEGDVVVYDLDTSDIDVTTDAAPTTVTFGALDVDYNYATATTSGLVVTTVATQTGDLLRVEMNDDGEITLLENITTTYSAVDYDNSEMELDGLDIVADTVVFNVTSDIDEVDDWEVVDVENLPTTLDTNGLQYDYSASTFNVLAMVIDDVASDTYFALIDAEDYWNGSKVVEKLTVWEVGEEKVYYTNTESDLSTDKVETIVTLSFSGDKVNGISTEASIEIEAESVDSKRITDEGPTTSSSDDVVHNYADDFAVYLIEEDGDWLVADYNDIQDGDKVDLYKSNGEVKVAVVDLGQYTETPTPVTPATGIEMEYTSPASINLTGLTANTQYAIRVETASSALPIDEYGVTMASGATTGTATMTQGDLSDNVLYKVELFKVGTPDVTLKTFYFVADL